VMDRWKKALTVLLLVGALFVGAAAVPSASAFKGYHCTRHTCKFFTSSYHTARYFYNRRTCDQWKELSNKYLRGFRTKRALKRHFDRKLHPPC